MKKSPELTNKITAYLPPTGHILDIGSGDAVFLKHLIGKGYELTGIDPEYPEKSQKITTDLTLIKGHGESIPLQDNRADAILMQCVFSLCKPEETLTEIRRVLKPGGILIVTDLISGTKTVSRTFACQETLTRDTVVNNGTNPETTSGPGIGFLYTKEDMEEHFNNSFTLKYWSNEKNALIEMLIQSIFDDTQLCISSDEQTFLKQHKAGYGLWVWERGPEA